MRTRSIASIVHNYASSRVQTKLRYNCNQSKDSQRVDKRSIEDLDRTTKFKNANEYNKKHMISLNVDRARSLKKQLASQLNRSLLQASNCSQNTISPEHTILLNEALNMD